MQCKGTVERWAREMEDVNDYGKLGGRPTVGCFYRHCMAGTTGAVQKVKYLFNSGRASIVPEGYPDIDYGSYEFWTALGEMVRLSEHYY